MIIVPIIQALAGLYVLAVGLIALNHMGVHTANRVRISYLALTSGSLAAIASAFGNPGIAESIFVTGVALYLMVNRRGARRHV